MPYAAAKNFSYPTHGHGSCLSMTWRLMRECAGEKKMGCIIFPFSCVILGENVIKIYQKAVTQQTNSNVT